MKKSNTSQPTLSILCNPDGFSFFASTAKGDFSKELKLHSPADFPDQFETFVRMKEWAGKEDIKVSIIDFSDHFLLLPSAIGDEEHIKTFFNFQYLHEEEYQIFTAPLCDEKQIFCWEIPSSRDRCFERLFPNLTLLSSSYILANWVIRQAILLRQSTLIAHLYGKSMHLFVADTQKLLFANSFPINNHQEMPYFILRCMEQLSLNPVQTRCFICSESVSGQPITEILSPYIRHIEMAEFTHSKEEPLQIIDKRS